MRNIKLTITYDGTNYKGWQLQKNGNTVQAELEKAIQKVFGKHYRIAGASRTDSGVHAKCQVANFKASQSISLSKIPAALNRVLPQDIAVKKAEEVSKDFHAQFDAKRKKYYYYIYNSRSRDPFEEKYAHFVPFKLNVVLMKREAKALIGKHDFKSFATASDQRQTSVRTITKCRVINDEPWIYIDVEADGFLYNMVRNIVGTLVEIARGYWPPEKISDILRARDRSAAGPIAPPQGLCLIKINY